MAGGGGDAPPPVDGGEFLLQLLRKPTPHHHYHPDQSQSSAHPPQPTQILTHDPAVAAFGPTFSVPFPHQLYGPTTPPPWAHNQNLHQPSPPPPLAPHGYFIQNPNSNLSQIVHSASPPNRGQINFQQNNAQLNDNSSWDGVRNSGFLGTSSNSSSVHPQDAKDLVFGSLRATEKYGETLDILRALEDKRKLEFLRSKEQIREVGLEDIGRLNGYGINFQQVSADQNTSANSSIFRGHGQEGIDNSRRGTGYWDRPGQNFSSHRAVVPPPGFSHHQINGGTREQSNLKEKFEQFGDSRYRSGKDESERRFSSREGDRVLSRQLDRPGPPAGSKLPSAPASDIEVSMMVNHAEVGDSGGEFGNGMRETTKGDVHRGHAYLDDLEDHLVDSLGLEDESDERSDQKKHHGQRDKDYRSDKRGQWLLNQRMRQLRRQVACRGDIDRWNAPLLAIYESLIPAEEEKGKQKQLLALLEKIVSKEWPGARIFLYGSCANSFGFSKSDIDVCLTIADADINKADVLLKLADLLQLENLQNVQALTRARVPIVKLMDPATGISCDICINNVLAVVNTKLLRDYAQIDNRLRQLAFLVKHWAKSRGVNETYQGTLSSYAYVLMCIHFLQHRRPAILPCLQEMKATYAVTVDNVECSFFDQVEKLAGFGSRNRETIAHLVWAFFNYWAYCHDYANDVISVRAGTILSKRAKDWTRRIGNDRHLICIEDPFETSHDLGRVVDKRSIKVLREEFERAAEIIQHDPNPCVKLFEPYIPV